MTETTTMVALFVFAVFMFGAMVYFKLKKYSDESKEAQKELEFSRTHSCWKCIHFDLKFVEKYNELGFKNIGIAPCWKKKILTGSANFCKDCQLREEFRKNEEK